MKGFIEVTDKNSNNNKRLIAISRIQHVGNYDDDTIIVFNNTFFKRKTRVDFICTTESYEEVVAKIKEATE